MHARSHAHPLIEASGSELGSMENTASLRIDDTDPSTLVSSILARSSGAWPSSRRARLPKLRMLSPELTLRLRRSKSRWVFWEQDGKPPEQQGKRPFPLLPPTNVTYPVTRISLSVLTPRLAAIPRLSSHVTTTYDRSIFPSLPVFPRILCATRSTLMIRSL